MIQLDRKMKHTQPQRYRHILNAKCRQIMGQEVEFHAVRRQEYIRLHHPELVYGTTQPEDGYAVVGFNGTKEYAQRLVDKYNEKDGGGWVVEPYGTEYIDSKDKAWELIDHLKDNHPDKTRKFKERLFSIIKDDAKVDVAWMDVVFHIQPIHICEAFTELFETKPFMIVTKVVFLIMCAITVTGILLHVRVST